MPVLVPLAAIPAQSLTIQLGGQSCLLNVYQKTTGLYVDLAVNDVPLVYGVLALNLNFIVREAYLGFDGDFSFNDITGADDPTYDGLGVRFVLLWYGADELPDGVY